MTLLMCSVHCIGWWICVPRSLMVVRRSKTIGSTFINLVNAEHLLSEEHGRDRGAGGGGGRGPFPPQYFENYKELVRKSVLCPPISKLLRGPACSSLGRIKKSWKSARISPIPKVYFPWYVQVGNLLNRERDFRILLKVIYQIRPRPHYTG